MTDTGLTLQQPGAPAADAWAIGLAVPPASGAARQGQPAHLAAAGIMIKARMDYHSLALATVAGLEAYQSLCLNP